MADEDKEKAEKVAAARKRYEQLKKQKAKKEQAAKKNKAAKDEKEDVDDDNSTVVDDVKQDTTTTEEAAAESTIKDADEPDLSSMPNLPPALDGSDVKGADDAAIDNAGSTEASEEPSLFEQSRIRSQSFKRGESQTHTDATRGSSMTPSGGDTVTDIYKKQAARIEELEKDSRTLAKEVEDKQKTLSRVEQENEDLREAQADTADLKLSAGRVGKLEEDLEKVTSEVSSLQRQNAQLQSQAKENRRRTSSTPGLSSSTSEDLQAQLDTKSNTIESLELDLSNLRYSFTTTQSENATLLSRITTLESSLVSTETFLKSAQDELSPLRAVSTSSDSTSDSAEATRIQLLTRDLTTAQSHATAETTRAAILQKQNDALKTIHRESEARSQAATASVTKERDRLKAENLDLRAKAGSMSSENARLRASSVTAPANGDDGNGDADPAKQHLQNRIHALEAELHDLRSGLWRNRRIELQRHGDGSDVGSEAALMDDDPGVRSPRSVYDDVDLNASMSASVAGTGTPPGVQRMRSSPYGAFGLQNVISAFTGAPTPGSARSPGEGARPRGRRESSQRGQGVDVAGLAGGFFGAVAEMAGVATGIAASNGHGQGDGFAAGGEGYEDEDFAFDEDAFRKAREEEGMKRLERVREIKRGLKEWEGWRVDLVDLRGGAGAGVFEV